jgi:hypothetical protein
MRSSYSSSVGSSQKFRPIIRPIQVEKFTFSVLEARVRDDRSYYAPDPPPPADFGSSYDVHDVFGNPLDLLDHDLPVQRAPCFQLKI